MNILASIVLALAVYWTVGILITLPLMGIEYPVGRAEAVKALAKQASLHCTLGSICWGLFYWLTHCP